MNWYQTLRESYRPTDIRVLFVGESPPDPGDAQRRFFYSPRLFSADNLFRGLMKALYDADSSDLRDDKPQWLGRFKDDGFWLVDLTDRPVNQLSDKERRRVRSEAAPHAAARIQATQPSAGVIVCHTPTYKVLVNALGTGSPPILHDQPIPFPLGNHRARFVELVREALRKAAIDVQQ